MESIQKNELCVNDALLNSSSNNNSSSIDSANYNNYSNKKLIGPNYSALTPTPFELAANANDQNGSNVVHIIQHPSWRINIKQPQNQQMPNRYQANHHYNGTQIDENQGIQLPFNYMKTNIYKS